MEEKELLTMVPAQAEAPAMVPAALGAMVMEIMRPVMATLTTMLEQNTAALDQLAAAQSIQNDRLEALERQIRLNTPVSSKEAQYINERLRGRAYELLDKRGVSGDRKAVTKLAGVIRKSLTAYYGAASIREIPKHEYKVAMHLIDMWNGALAVRDIAKEAKDRVYQTAEGVGVDGGEPLAGVDD